MFVSDVTRFCKETCVDAVVTGNEFLTPLVTLVCDQLSLPSNVAEQAYAARNKVAMSHRLACSGVLTPRTFVITNAAELERLLTSGRVGLPFVIKPADNAGSNGVTVVLNADDRAEAYRYAAGPETVVPFGMTKDRRILVQEYIEGAEFSVESITQHGIPHHVCITRKLTSTGAHRVELGHAVPAGVDEAAERLILHTAGQAIKAVGIENGPSHTEVKLDSQGRCVVIEIAGRVGGAPIADLVQLAHGVDMFRACVDVALGIPAAVKRSRNDYATARFFTAPSQGKIASVTGLPLQDVTVPVVRLRRQVGDAVGDNRGNGCRVGHFIVTGSDRSVIERRAESLSSQILVEITEAG
ncbi:hypothetical protein ED92_33135 [Amycolatopsis sp. MJM2582]|nr:hypothetical protein ED92_33135 [Amycolatopsis sp. MJM2582]